MSDFYYEHYGYCPICAAPTRFMARQQWFRDHYVCEKCGSLPRQRALMIVLESLFPNWRDADVYEASPSGPTSDRLSGNARNTSPATAIRESSQDACTTGSAAKISSD